MSQYYGYYRSNDVEVTDQEGLTDLMEEVERGDYVLDGFIEFNEQTNTVFLMSTEDTFSVWDGGLEERVDTEFLKQLASCIGEKMKITSVGFSVGHKPDAYEYVITPNGQIDKKIFT